MRGVIEIFRGAEKISEESNLIVDSASEVIANALTVFPGVSAISSASSILDSSNYTVQAISFGKDGSAYSMNGHDVVDGQKAIAAVAPLLGGYDQYTTLGFVSALSTSSYYPTNLPPKHPKPIDVALEVDFPDGSPNSQKIYGHNLNFIQYVSVPDAKKLRAFPDDTSVATIATSRSFGCYAQREGTYWELSLSGPSYTQITSGVHAGGLNAVSALDFRGFIRAYTSAEESSPGSGLIVSADNDFSSTGQVKYVVTLPSGDVGMANLFGGILTAGLWALDISGSLATGVLPPYNWIDASGVTDREYKLFSKKSLLDNICKIDDSGTDAGVNNHSDITIIWTLYFV